MIKAVIEARLEEHSPGARKRRALLLLSGVKHLDTVPLKWLNALNVSDAGMGRGILDAFGGDSPTVNKLRARTADPTLSQRSTLR